MFKYVDLSVKWIGIVVDEFVENGVRLINNMFVGVICGVVVIEIGL